MATLTIRCVDGVARSWNVARAANHLTNDGGSERTRERFEVLLARHAGILGKLTSVDARAAEDRRDLAQETTMQLWRALASFDPARAAFSTWMYRIALDVAISQLRRARPTARRALHRTRAFEIAQLLAWLALVMVAGSFWISQRASPALLVGGLVMHAYGLLAIAVGVRQLLLLDRVDHAQPIVQHRVDRVLARVGRLRSRREYLARAAARRSARRIAAPRALDRRPRRSQPGSCDARPR